MAGLTGGEIGRFEIPGVVFTLCLAAGIGGGGMGLVGGFRQTFEARYPGGVASEGAADRAARLLNAFESSAAVEG